jgi:hypothetical protein
MLHVIILQVLHEKGDDRQPSLGIAASQLQTQLSMSLQGERRERVPGVKSNLGVCVGRRQVDHPFGIGLNTDTR